MVFLIFILSAAYAYITVPVKVSSGNKSSLNSFQKGSQSLATGGSGYKTQYYATFKVGTPAQSISLLLDTRSSWIWLPSKDCICHSSTGFNSLVSSTYWDIGVSRVIEYNEGKIIGSIGEENFSFSNFTVKSQLFILIDQDFGLDYLDSDGGLGLGFKELSDYNPTFIENLKNQGSVNESIFSFWFPNINWNSPKDPAFTIGGYDSDQYGTGYDVAINIRPGYGHWTIFIESISVNKTKPISSKSAAILDASAYLLLGPKAQVKSILDKIKTSVRNCNSSSELLECKCSLESLSKFPEITFYIDENSFSVKPENYLYHNDGKCTILISNSSDSKWILGQPFFREYYTVYDMDKLQVRLWKAKQNYFELKSLTNDESFDFIQSSVLIPAGLIVSGIVYVYCRRQINPFNYQLI